MQRGDSTPRPETEVDPPSHRPPHAVVADLIAMAAGRGSSDIFLCSNEDHVAVFARHLGEMRRVESLSLDLGRHCLAHIKTTAGMDPTERRHPLDGRFGHRLPDGGVLDVRIETVPTLHGEDMALRLLDRRSRLLKLDALGMSAEDRDRVRGVLGGPGGLVLVSGPSGSGKTTTLYAMLNDMNSGGRKIHTIEDPVEYALPGVRQSQVNLRIGLDFPDLLRAVLRQGPDVIMIGEVRDPVTAQTAVRAANSGHLVLATVHAPSAAGAVQSLLGFGVAAEHLASGLRMAVSQRLVRTLCPECKRPAAASDSQPSTACDPVGCVACHQLGFAGRTGLFELLSVTDPIRRLILAGGMMQAIHDAAVAAGMVPIGRAGLVKAAAGETTPDEVARVAAIPPA
jgi:type II secretory ATPase GspE/PulE/Tfp pilus assembly ATPase PilB-like protein